MNIQDRFPLGLTGLINYIIYQDIWRQASFRFKQKKIHVVLDWSINLNKRYIIVLENLIQFSSVQLLSRVLLFGTPWTAAHQASLSVTNSWSLFKLISIESVMPSSHLILCHPLLLLPSVFPSIGPFPTSWLLASGGWISTGGSASSWVLPMNIQGWFPLVLIGLIALQSKGLSRVFSKTTVQKHQFFSAQPCGPALTSIHDSWKNHSFDYRDLCQLFELWGKS